MLNRTWTSTVLAAAVLTMSFGCSRDNSTANTTPTNGPGERAGQAVDSATRSTADAARDAANRTGAAANNAAVRTDNAVNSAAARTSAGANNIASNVTQDTTNNAHPSATQTSNSSVPGLPSVQGTSTNNMSTADAAAQRLIDNARNNLKQNDISKAKTLVAELQNKGMYDSLSSAQKANVDQLAKDVNSATPTAQENH